jgi:phage-related protein
LIIVIPLLISSIIIRIIHAAVKTVNIIPSIVPPALNILRNVLNLLDLPASPSRRIFWEVFDIIDSIVPAILDSITEAFKTSDLLARPVRCVLRHIGDVVAELVEATLDAVLVFVIVFLCGSSCQHQT